MDGPGNHYINQNKPDSERQTPHFNVCVRASVHVGVGVCVDLKLKRENDERRKGIRDNGGAREYF